MSLLAVIILLRFALSAIFAVAGWAKLMDPRGTREAVINFGAPATSADSFSLLLPWVEIAIALGLLLPITAGWSAILALILLTFFAITIGVNLYRGRKPECHCFGQLYSRPLGWPTLARNLVFALGAALIVWRGHSEIGADVSLERVAGRNAAYVPAAFVLTMTALALWKRRHNESLTWIDRLTKNLTVSANPSAQTERSQGLPLSSVAPAFDLVSYHGGRRSLAQLLGHRKALMLVFTNPTCGPCVIIFREIAEWQQTHSEPITIAVISQGTIKDNFVNVARNGLENIFLQQDREVAELYQAHATPTAVLIQADGRIGSGLAAGADEIRKLLHETIADSG